MELDARARAAATARQPAYAAFKHDSAAAARAGA